MSTKETLITNVLIVLIIECPLECYGFALEFNISQEKLNNILRDVSPNEF